MTGNLTLACFGRLHNTTESRVMLHAIDETQRNALSIVERRHEQ